MGPQRRTSTLLAPRVRDVAVVFAIVGVALGSVAAPAVQAVASSDPPSGVADGPVVEPGPAFVDETYTDHRGDVVGIDLRTGNRSTASLGLVPADGSASDYRANLTVRDADGDGRVRVRFNTYAAGNGELTTFEARGNDTIVDAEEQLLVGPLGNGTYELSIAPGTDTDPEVTDRATVSVRPRSLESARFLVSVDATADLARASDVRAMERTGALDYIPAFGREDLVVLEVNATGLSGAFAVADGATATERFFAMDDGAVEASLLERAVTVGTQEEPVRIPLADRRVTRVLPDPKNDTYYVAANVSAFVDLYGDDYRREGVFYDGDLFAAQFEIAENTTLAPEGESLEERSFEFVERTAKIAPDHPVYVAPERNQTIGGYADFGPGRTLTIVVTDRQNGSFEQRRSVVVDEEGRFAATFDFDGVPGGTGFEVDVRFRNRSVLAEPKRGVVQADVAAVSIEDEDLVDPGAPRITFDARLGHGGYVAAFRNGSTGDLVGVTSYLQTGIYRNRTVEVRTDLDAGDNVTLVAYRDADGLATFDRDGDEPYTRDGEPVAASITVGGQPQTPDATVTPTGTRSSPATTTPTEPPSTTQPPTTQTTPLPASPGSPEGTSTTAHTPGPGLVVLTLSTAVVLAARRRAG